MIISALATGTWLGCAAIVLRRPAPQASSLRVALACIGVPVLGIVTYQQGPLMGLGALALGTCVLSLPRLRRH